MHLIFYLVCLPVLKICDLQISSETDLLNKTISSSEMYAIVSEIFQFYKTLDWGFDK